MSDPHIRKTRINDAIDAALSEAASLLRDAPHMRTVSDRTMRGDAAANLLRAAAALTQALRD